MLAFVRKHTAAQLNHAQGDAMTKPETSACDSSDVAYVTHQTPAQRSERMTQRIDVALPHRLTKLHFQQQVQPSALSHF
jgi:hypothetical protein